MRERMTLIVLALLALLSACKPLESVPEPLVRAQEQIQCSSNVEFSEASERSVSPTLSRRLAKTANQTREASVYVYNVDSRGRGSGTYFEHEGRHIVVTAGHVSNYSPVLIVTAPSGEEVIAFNAYQELSDDNDFSVLLLTEPLTTRTPMEFKVRQSHERMIGETLVYTGHPASHESLTIFGQVAGFADNQNIIFHSYAWMGASGSAVFDERGRLVGILRAVDFNPGPIVPQITEDIVWLSPATSIDTERLDKILTVINLLQELEEE